MTLTMPDKIHSHFVTLGNDHKINREEIYLDYPEKWRGADVVVTMRADRYEANFQGEGNKLTEWRVYASDARPADREGQTHRPAPLTDLARRRLSDKLRDDATAFLATPEFEAAHQDAVVRAVKRVAMDLKRHYGSTPLRQAMVVHMEALTYEQRVAFAGAAEAYDNYVAAIEAL